MYNLGSTPIGYSDLPLSVLYPTYTRNLWQIEWLFKDGGSKVLLDFDLESYVISFDFELNEKLCGAAAINMSFIDFPINIDDIIILRYSGEPIYRGYIETIPDPKGGKIKIEPYHKRFDTLLYSGSFTSKTIIQILQTIIENVYSISDIRWLASQVDITDATTYTFSYDNEKVKKIIDDLVKKIDDRYWGVSADNIFTVYSDSSSVDRILDNCENQEYRSSETDIDYSKITTTRYKVYKKVADSDSVYIGEVGNSSDYPSITLEQVTHAKEEKLNITVPDFTDSQALDFAYAKLTAQQAPVSTKIKGFNIDNGLLEIGQKIKIYDNLYLTNKRILNCNSLTDDCTLTFFDDGTSLWDKTNGTLSVDTSIYVLDGYSIKYVNTAGMNSEFRYDFVNDVVLKKPYKINFMIYATEITKIDVTISNVYDYLVDEYGNYLVDESGNYLIVERDFYYSFQVEIINKWRLYTIDLSNENLESITKIAFSLGSVSQRSIYIDNFCIFGYFKNEVSGNVKKISYKIDKGNINLCDVDLDYYDKQLNDNLFIWERKIDEIESMTQEKSS